MCEPNNLNICFKNFNIKKQKQKQREKEKEKAYRACR